MYCPQDYQQYKNETDNYAQYNFLLKDEENTVLDCQL